MTKFKPKLIEVALPLDTISAEAAREKSIPHSHPSTLHRWWARRPLAAARAVIWASLVDDPSCDDSLSEEEKNAERQRLFKILERLVDWDNSSDRQVLSEAKAEIDRCFPDGPPPVLDPFGGGGAIPLEAQRLGLNAISGDLNPVAVIIQKAMIEIPPRFAGQPPVHPDLQNEMPTWERAQGLAADVQAYGQWMHEEALKRIDGLYPELFDSNGCKLTPVAYVWARTIESPDPYWRGHVPLVASWILSSSADGQKVWVQPVIDREDQSISYRIRTDGEPTVERTCVGGKGICVATGATIPSRYIKEAASSGNLRQQLIAIVAKSDHGRVFVAPDPVQESAASSAQSAWAPDERLPEKALGFRVQPYGMTAWADLFTSRQLVALTTFSSLLTEVWQRVRMDALGGGGVTG